MPLSALNCVFLAGNLALRGLKSNSDYTILRVDNWATFSLTSLDLFLSRGSDGFKIPKGLNSSDYRILCLKVWDASTLQEVHKMSDLHHWVRALALDVKRVSFLKFVLYFILNEILQCSTTFTLKMKRFQTAHLQVSTFAAVILNLCFHQRFR